MGEIYGVILAAGAGNRLRPLSFHQPKPLLPVCNKPIIQYQIEAMRDLGIKKVYIVVGHLSTSIIKYFGSGARLGVQIEYVHQDKRLGIAHAVAQLEPYINRPFLLFLGDIFFITKNLKQMITVFQSRQAGGVIAVKKEKEPDSVRRNFAVLLNDDGTVRRVVEKPRFPASLLKGCGIYLFDLPVFDAIRQTPRTAMRDEYEITASIQILIQDGYPVYPVEVVRWDMNVTEPCDLLICCRRQLREKGLTNVIGEGSEVHPEAEIIESVIGKGVVVERPIMVKGSLILDGSVLKSMENVEYSLIGPDSIIRCPAEREESENEV